MPPTVDSTEGEKKAEKQDDIQKTAKSRKSEKEEKTVKTKINNEEIK